MALMSLRSLSYVKESIVLMGADHYCIHNYNNVANSNTQLTFILSMYVQCMHYN